MNRAVILGLGVACLGLAWLFWRAFQRPGLHPVWSEDDERALPVLRALRWLGGLLVWGSAACVGALLVLAGLFQG